MSRSLSENLKLKCEKIDSEIIKYIGEPDGRFSVLFDAVRYSASAGGKRIRPVLTLAFAELFGADEATALPFACAVEMVHTYSLIHDDLPCMDNDDIRRGKPTNHKVYGEATALLAGDALLTAAFGVIASNSMVSSDIISDAVKLLSDSAGSRGMIGGQQLDLISENKKQDYDTMIYMHSLKTGCLIRAACLLGCLAAGKTKGTEEYADAEKYASCIGLAFQITDDILDAGEEDNKTTFLSYMDISSAEKEAKRLTAQAVETISKYNGSGFLSELAEYLAVRKV